MEEHDEQLNPTNDSVTDISIESLQEQLSTIEKKSAEYLEGWKRAKADYSNLKRETENRQVETIQYANAALIAELMPVVNNFTLALRHIPAESQEADWVKGLFFIKKQFEDFLRQLGIEPIKTVGEQFDPTLHDAMVSEEHEGTAADIVFEEVMPGYTLHGKVLMPAKVKVAK